MMEATKLFGQSALTKALLAQGVRVFLIAVSMVIMSPIITLGIISKEVVAP
jgi:hypothetical protein